MRQSCSWFAERAAMVWRARPGRSLLLLVPHGCDEPATAAQVARWTADNFLLPKAYGKHSPLIIRLTSDTFPTSQSFALSLAREVGKALGAPVAIDKEDYPTQIIESAVQDALAAARLPVLILQRFHAFAAIRDGGMGSVLAGMRELEHASQLTTLAMSPATYDDIRSQMASESPFLNSVYGDNHDRAIMEPLDRTQFVADATARGIAPARAHRLFALAAGPDDLCNAILDHHNLDGVELASACIAEKGGMLDKFVKRSFPKVSTDDLASLALGRLGRPKEAHLKANPLWRFIAREAPSGGIACASPILAHYFLKQGTTVAQSYERSLAAYAAGHFQLASEFASTLCDKHPRLKAFRDLVIARAALEAQPDRGFLGIEWERASTALNCLAQSDVVPDAVGGWVERMSRWASLVRRYGDAGGGRSEAWRLARASTDPEVRFALLYTLSGLVKNTSAERAPNNLISTLINVPETILQAMACGLCSIDIFRSPAAFPPADYERFFGGRPPFRLPAEGQKMMLGTLLVAVPALLPVQLGRVTEPFSDPDVIRPLQQKLVDRLRNIASHTIADFPEADARYLSGLCSEWLDAWARLEGFNSSSEIPGLVDVPTTGALSALLFDAPELTSESEWEA
ncbi:MAG: hypothetical protein EON59_01575 [Alphaproteobacteria bacterium]|nr:MAG: hypothetical protein EON59_01575 [Alphaproteobacteria bacterium]